MSDDHVMEMIVTNSLLPPLYSHVLSAVTSLEPTLKALTTALSTEMKERKKRGEKLPPHRYSMLVACVCVYGFPPLLASLRRQGLFLPLCVSMWGFVFFLIFPKRLSRTPLTHKMSVHLTIIAILFIICNLVYEKDSEPWSCAPIEELGAAKERREAGGGWCFCGLKHSAFHRTLFKYDTFALIPAPLAYTQPDTHGTAIKIHGGIKNGMTLAACS